MLEVTALEKKPSLQRRADPFRRCDPDEVIRKEEPYVHVYGNRIICETDKRGYPTPDNKSDAELKIDAPSGFIRLWAKGTTLRWRFQERSMSIFDDPEAAKREISALFGEAMLAWGDAAPIKFDRTDSNVHFEIVVRKEERCDAIRRCVLASAFFPTPGPDDNLLIYPTMLDQNRTDKIHTLTHEIGHIFGLRHFFAQLSRTEAKRPSEVFGVDRPVSIMNYGPDSQLTAYDKSDLKRLYELAWSGQLTEINGTPIKFVEPFA